LKKNRDLVNNNDNTKNNSKNFTKKNKDKKITYKDDDDDDDDDYIMEDDIEDIMDSDDEEFDTDEYRKMLSEMFPSKYMNEKVDNTINKRKNNLNDIIPTKKLKTKKNNQKTKDDDILNNGTQFNIIFSMNENDDSCNESENEEYEISSESDSETDDNNISMEIDENINNNKIIIDKLKKTCEDLKQYDKDNSIINNIIEKTEEKEKEYKKLCEQKNKKNKLSNLKSFKKLLRDKNVLNDLHYFKEKLDIDEQNRVLNNLEEIKKFTNVEKPYRLAIVDADMPNIFKSIALKKMSTLNSMEPGSSEYFKIKNWVDTFMNIPFGKYKNLPININDGIDKCHDFMYNAKKVLDNAVFGLDDAKLQILQMIGQLIANPNAVGTAIAIKGPMGTGKTTLVKEGISKILNREFAFIALGGATDSSFLEGHSYTYEGSTWGKIVEILIQCKSMNPIIYFDELDKVSDTPKGEEIIGILTHLIDTSQNSQFHDKYFSEIDFDLSKCLFIFSYNDESKVNPILRDRMYRIQTKGYNKTEKTTISNSYLLPNILKQVNFQQDDIKIPDETLHYIIENFTEKEDGVRNLKRCLEIIHTKLNLYRLMKPGSNLFKKDLDIDVKFPVNVDIELVNKFIKKVDTEQGPPFGMYN